MRLKCLDVLAPNYSTKLLGGLVVDVSRNLHEARGGHRPEWLIHSSASVLVRWRLIADETLSLLGNFTILGEASVGVSYVYDLWA